MGGGSVQGSYGHGSRPLGFAYFRSRRALRVCKVQAVPHETEVFKKGLSQVEEMGKKYVVLIPKKTSNRITTKSYYQNQNLY